MSPARRKGEAAQAHETKGQREAQRDRAPAVGWEGQDGTRGMVSSKPQPMDTGRMLAIARNTLFAVTFATVFSHAATSLSDPPEALLPAGVAPAHVWGTENPMRAFNQFINSFFFSEAFVRSVEAQVGVEAGYYLVSYLRDLIAGFAVYWGVAGVWSFFVYTVFGKDIFEKNGRSRPTWDTIRNQMQVASCSLFIYAMLPVFSEWLIESGFTKVYFYTADNGGATQYALNFAAYALCFELGIYWMHRKLHTNKWLYKNIHAKHHAYTLPQTMTPWASIAFNPIDGILQASPYVFCLFFIPTHYFTHILLLFGSGVWATSIHDGFAGESAPILGSQMHTLHHTHLVYNHGNMLMLMDWAFGTLRYPDKGEIARLENPHRSD